MWICLDLFFKIIFNAFSVAFNFARKKSVLTLMVLRCSLKLNCSKKSPSFRWNGCKGSFIFQQPRPAALQQSSWSNWQRRTFLHKFGHTILTLQDNSSDRDLCTEQVLWVSARTKTCHFHLATATRTKFVSFDTICASVFLVLAYFLQSS